MAIVPYTCPDIDKIIKHVNQALIYLSSAEIEIDTDSKDQLISDASSELEDLEGMLEDLRKSNSTLREYGEEQEGIIDNIRSQFDTFKEAMNDLI